MSPVVDRALQGPILFVVVVIIVSYFVCFLPGVIASGFLVSSDMGFRSSLGCAPALSRAFFSLLDMARIFLG